MFRLDSPDMAKARQEALYSFLLSQGNKWTRMQDTVLGVGHYPEFNPTADFHDSTARRWLTSDIEAINSSDDFSLAIISNSNGIKLATEDELTDFLLAEYTEVFRKLKRVRAINRKATMDGQMNLEGEVRQSFLEADDG